MIVSHGALSGIRLDVSLLGDGAMVTMKVLGHLEVDKQAECGTVQRHVESSPHHLQPTSPLDPVKMRLEPCRAPRHPA